MPAHCILLLGLSKFNAASGECENQKYLFVDESEATVLLYDPWRWGTRAFIAGFHAVSSFVSLHSIRLALVDPSGKLFSPKFLSQSGLKRRYHTVPTRKADAVADKPQS